MRVKIELIIIDHMGCYFDFGLPDKSIDWASSKDTKHSTTVCGECHFVYSVTAISCPKCGSENKVLFGKESNQKAIKTIDMKLVLIERDKIKKEKLESVRFEDVSPPDFGIANKVAAWFCEQIKEDVKPHLIQKFLKLITQDFFFKNFTMRDLNTLNKEKCLEAYNRERV